MKDHITLAKKEPVISPDKVEEKPIERREKCQANLRIAGFLRWRRCCNGVRNHRTSERKDESEMHDRMRRGQLYLADDAEIVAAYARAQAPLDEYNATGAEDLLPRLLGRVGYGPVYGARPLKRAVQKYLQDPLADAILRGEIRDGQKVKVDEGDGALLLQPS